MSRGLGVMERAVAWAIDRNIRGHKDANALKNMLLEAFGEEPDRPVVLLTPWLVCGALMEMQGEDWSPPTRAQLKSAARAMHSFVRKFTEYDLISGRGRLCLYQRGDELGAMWAKLNSQRKSFVPRVWAKEALAHVAARRNERFAMHEHKRSPIFIPTRKGKRRAPKKVTFRDITLPAARKDRS
jgi:hypothetical protein